jgi:hypothetical protein
MLGCASCGPHSGKLHQVVFVAQGRWVKHCHQYLGCSWFCQFPPGSQLQPITPSSKNNFHTSFWRKTWDAATRCQCEKPSRNFQCIWKAHFEVKPILHKQKVHIKKKSMPLQWVFFFGKYVKISASALHRVTFFD